MTDGRTTRDAVRALERIRAFCWANRDAWALTEAIGMLKKLDEEQEAGRDTCVRPQNALGATKTRRTGKTLLKGITPLTAAHRSPQRYDDVKIKTERGSGGFGSTGK